MSLLRSFAVGAALVVMLAACGSESSTTDVAAAADDTSAVPTSAPITGSFATVAGGQVDLGSLEGQDTVLWFWAPW